MWSAWWDTMEHLENPDAYLRKLAGAMKPGL
jgi:hypothetical protein